MTGEKLGLAFTPNGEIRGVQPGSEAAQKGIMIKACAPEIFG